jgi:hypothetical protein
MPWLDGQPSLLQLASNWTSPSGAHLMNRGGRQRGPPYPSLLMYHHASKQKKMTMMIPAISAPMCSFSAFAGRRP